MDTDLKAKTNVKNFSTIEDADQYITGQVLSKDGTTIGYRQLGHGPGLIILHGTMESSQSHRQLAKELANSFTVYLPDRRGRGMSGPHGARYSLQKEVEDLDALLTKTDTHKVFGVSSGAIVLLQAMNDLPSIHKAGIFEPPVPVNDSLSTGFIARYDQEIARGKLSSAMVTAMLGAQMGPAIFQHMPRWLLELITVMMMAIEEKNAVAGDVTMRMLAPTFHYDGQLVLEMAGKLDSFKPARAQVCLFGGSTSPFYLKYALETLEKIFPQAKHVEFQGLGHGATGNKDKGGQPKSVAEELRKFFI